MSIEDYKKKSEAMQKERAEQERLRAEHSEWEKKSKKSASELLSLKYSKRQQKSDLLTDFIINRCEQDELEVIKYSTGCSVELGIKGTPPKVIYFEFLFNDDFIYLYEDYDNCLVVYEGFNETKRISFRYVYKNYPVFKSDENWHNKNDCEDLLRDIERFKAEIEYDEVVKNFVSKNNLCIMIEGCKDIFDDYEKFWKKIFE
nr:hypothetical protein [Treponema denticola]